MEGTPIIVKKKKAHGHAHHGGSWKVAYADFVTAMMAFFMVMWILGLSDAAKTQISGYFNDPLGYSKTSPMSRNIVKFPGNPITRKGTVAAKPDIRRNDKKQVIMVAKLIREALQAAINKGIRGKDGKLIDVKNLAAHLDIEMTREGLRIEFREDKSAVFFESGSAVIRPEALALIQPLAKILAQSARPMKIEGHTDAVPYAASGYDNWDLSGDRANSMRRALQSDGVKSDQLLEVSGYAATRLRDATHPASLVNRRVSVLLPIPELSDSAGGETGTDIVDDVSLAPEIDLRKKKKEAERDAMGFPIRK